VRARPLCVRDVVFNKPPALALAAVCAGAVFALSCAHMSSTLPPPPDMAREDQSGLVRTDQVLGAHLPFGARTVDS
jgi:hypothetical protein